MRIADPQTIPGLYGLFYLIDILTYLLGKNPGSFIGMLIDVLCGIIMNPDDLANQIWILSDQLPLTTRLQQAWLGHISPEAMTDLPFPSLSIIAGLG